jgi:NADH-quinone oxidoreductase subunit J
MESLNALYVIAAVVAVVSAGLAVSRRHPVHALLYLALSALAVGLVLCLLGAPLAGAFEVVVFAGAILVLFVMVVMMQNLGRETVEQETAWLPPGAWRLPLLLAAVLLGEFAWLLFFPGDEAGLGWAISPWMVNDMLFGPYLLGVELASMLLLTGILAAMALTRPPAAEDPR